jgi:hypothetical protein
MELDKFSGAKCYTLSARALHISWEDSWEWINLSSDEIKRNKRLSHFSTIIWGF